jgi:hypothetical protein
MRVDLNILVKILVVVGSSASIGFGIWHFFVPYAWKWYSYIDPKATELIVVVRAINVFFSLSLVLFVAGLLTRLLSRSTLKQYFTYAISRPDKQRLMDTGFYKYIRHPGISDRQLSTERRTSLPKTGTNVWEISKARIWYWARPAGKELEEIPR